MLMGEEALRRMRDARVIIFGVGGVGSWCAESLVRSGIGHVTIVDSDCVALSNINRQLMATFSTVGMAKVDALKVRLQDINPTAEIVALQKIYSPDTANDFALDDYDYVIDAIDSLSNKALLIQQATASHATLISSMGAARKIDPTKIRIADFWDAEGCPLARALRKKFKRDNIRLTKKFKVVFSPEVLENKPTRYTDTTRANGTLMHVTATFGLMISSIVIEDFYSAE